MSILITGSSGFVGQNLVKYLQPKQLELRFVNREHLQKLTCDFLVKEEITSVIHLAGKAHDLKKVSSPDDYYRINFELTKRLYDAFLNSDAKQFFFISSVKAAADQVDVVLTEEYLPCPETHYGKSKFLAEQYIQSQLLPEGKSFFILRPCMIHGPGNKGNLNLLYEFVKRGIPYPFADFQNKRSFLSVGNLCFIIYNLLISNCIESGIYNVSDDEALSTNEVVSILGWSLNIQPRLWKIPKSMVLFFAKAGDLLHLPLTSERLNKLTESYVVSNKKIKHALNQELPITSVEGLKITASSFNRK
jgi:nucleoside-diphosphate-sugar epimerase